MPYGSGSGPIRRLRCRRSGSPECDHGVPDALAGAVGVLEAAMEEHVSLEELIRQHLDTVQQRGFTVVQVAADGLAPGWGYTVGLWKHYRHPELITVGMPPQGCAAVLTVLAERITNGAVLPGGINDEGLFKGRPHRYVNVGKAWRENSDWFNFGRLLAAEGWSAHEWPATVQVVWPDEQQRFPSDAGAPPGFCMLQPVLADAVGSRW